ncbi:hypothetical protein [Streptomyces sp. B6(2022)]|uniref:hypothetical protein n=1 Tax=Streptomyces sp. B6(2022) TaxID=3404749 RepID=UPI003AEFB27B
MSLAGTWALTRLALRRDRLVIPIWAVAVGGLVASGAGSLGGLYATTAERAELAASMSANSSMRALYGPVFGDSLGGLVAWRFGTFAVGASAPATAYGPISSRQKGLKTTCVRIRRIDADFIPAARRRSWASSRGF